MGRCCRIPKAAVYIYQLDLVSCKTETLRAAATRRSRQVRSVGVTRHTILLRVDDSRLSGSTSGARNNSLGPIRDPGYDPVRTRFPCQNCNPTEKLNLATKPNRIHVRQPVGNQGGDSLKIYDPGSDFILVAPRLD